MVITVVSEQRLPIDEVRSWTWPQLREAYAEVARSKYEAFTAGIREAQYGTARAIMATIAGKAVDELKPFDAVYRDPFAERVTPTGEPTFLHKVIKANTPQEAG